MMRRIKRSEHFEISLQISDQFIRPPRDAQRNWVLNRAIKEFSDELNHLNELTKGFVPGSDERGPLDRMQAVLRDEDIMEDWQIPIMREMARLVAVGQGDVLEIGFGRGIASTFIQESGVKSHTIVECNDSVVKKFEQWRQQRPDRDIRLLHGRWQDVLDQSESYDAVLFHTYPLNVQEFVERVVQGETFADNFFAVAGGLLRDQGVFTYFTNEIDSLSRGHQRLLLDHFSSLTLRRMHPLQVPRDTKDALWGDSIILITVIK